MAKKSPNNSRRPPDEAAISLFDRENLEFLDALRYQPARTAVTAASPAEHPSLPPTAEPGAADQIFAQHRIADNDESWTMGELNVRIIHRGKMRIRREEWTQVIPTCTTGLVEDGIRKDFYLNVLQHPRFVRLVYISYRHRRPGDKQHEHRRGILVDADTDIRDMMTRLSYWFTAQPYAEHNYALFEHLVNEAMTKLNSVPGAGT